MSEFSGAVTTSSTAPRLKREFRGGKMSQFKITRPGALTARAKKNGKTVAEEGAEDTGKSGLAGKQARFYENVLKPANAKRKKNKGVAAGAMTQALMSMQ